MKPHTVDIIKLFDSCINITSAINIHPHTVLNEMLKLSAPMFVKEIKKQCTDYMKSKQDELLWDLN